MIKPAMYGLLVTLAFACVANRGAAQERPGASPRRFHRGARPAKPVGYIADSSAVTQASCDAADVVGEGVIDGVFDGAGVETCGGYCDDACAGCGPWFRWSSGVEFTLLRPYFERNLAFTAIASDGATFETITDAEFDYSTELAPRVWLELQRGDGIGWRAVYWQFDHDPAGATGSPPDNGFGEIIHPPFGDVDLSTTTPDSIYTATSALNAYSIDFEGTKSFGFGNWGMMASTGIRFAEIEQTYSSRLQNAQNQQQGSIFFGHDMQGFGPTLSVRAQRPFSRRLALFGAVRGSLLYGDGESNLIAVEDQDLDIAFTTQRNSSRDDLLPIGECQVGFRWLPAHAGIWHPYVHIALEGQLWNGVGNASEETGDLGFYGMNVALGVDW